MLLYRVMDPKECIYYTSVTIINTLSCRTMYIRRWWKLKYIMILHIVHHYIPYNKIKAKNHKQYIFQILRKRWPKFGQKGPFLNFPIKCEYSIFLTPQTRLSTKTQQIIMNGLQKYAKNLHFWVFWAKMANFGQLLGKMVETGFVS